MALENSGELEATNLLLYIILTIDETPVKVGIQKQIRKYLFSSSFENRFWEIAT